ncbi:HAD-IA family hydrolase [Desulfobacterales bacterium HSG2]|nr:HAD-IA family hydrolase [Desulfobacterales bacterium HSG2]
MMKNKPFSIKAVLFDFDGTLTKPGALDFSALRKAIRCPADMPVLEFIEGLPTSEEQRDALAKLEQFELDAAEKSEPGPGAEDLVRYLHLNGIPVGIISRNSFQSINRALKNFKEIGKSDFDIIISRNDPVRPKPDPDGILLAAQRLKIEPEEVLAVGDFIFDIQAGQRAGAITVFLENDPGDQKSAVEDQKLKFRSDYTISHLGELKGIVRLGIPLPAGKFPNDLLKEVLDQFAFQDPSLLIYPGIGEDTVAVNVDGAEVLVLKSDPVTFTTDSVGHYAVLVNANDIATSGAVPRWFMNTLLFPCGTTPYEIYHTMNELKAVCQQWEITLCGGHTEITDAVTRPVVTGMLAGTVAKSDLIDKRNMEKGDKILLTKGVAVEGTSIIAREFGDRLKKFGMTEAEIENCRQFLFSLSILKEARIAARSPGTSAMHDVTEGGAATALEELGIAGRHKIRVFMDSIPVFPQTDKICWLFDINPLGLIGSGSLLICCREKSCKSLISRIQKAGIDVSLIGEVLEEGEGIEAVKDGKDAEWPRFETDEITRLF